MHSEYAAQHVQSLDSDDLLTRLGNPGRFQIVLFVLLSFQSFPVGMNDLMPIFYSIQPTEVYCKDVLDYVGLNGTADDDRSNISLIKTNLTDLCATPCKSSYVYRYPDRQWSIVADMNLICDRAPLVYLASTIYFFGALIGGLFWGEMADRFGRRKVLLITNILYTSFSGGTVFAHEYISFVLLRWFTGFSVMGMSTTYYVVIMEWLPSNRRGLFATVCPFFFTIANIILATVSSFLQHWRWIQLVVALSNGAALTYFWFAPEPLQWLLHNNQVANAKASWKKVAEFNGVDLSSEEAKPLDSSFRSLKSDKTHSMLDCFRTPEIRKKTLLICFAWFATFITYMGMSFVITDISPNVYHSLIIGGVMELIPCAMDVFLVAKFGSRDPLIFYFISAGIMAITVSVIPGSSYTTTMVQNVLAVLCRICILGALNAASFFTAELFPTVIRSSVFGLCGGAMHLGGMLSHELFLTSTPIFTGTPVLIVALIALLGGIATFMLPRSKGKLPETIKDVESVPLTTVKLPKFLRRRNILSANSKNVERVEFSVSRHTVSGNAAHQ